MRTSTPAIFIFALAATGLHACSGQSGDDLASHQNSDGTDLDGGAGRTGGSGGSDAADDGGPATGTGGSGGLESGTSDSASGTDGGSGGAIPGTGGATPGTGGDTPGTGGATPGTGGATPGTGGDTKGGRAGSGGAIGTGGYAGSPGTGGTLPVWPDPIVDAGVSTVSIVGVWSGYTENGVPPWDSSVRLVITSASETDGVRGTLTVGTGAPLPPVQDPNVGYPPGADLTPKSTEILNKVYPGFSYTLLNATVVNQRVRFTIARAEPWRAWCELQTSYPNSGGYACVPSANGFSVSNGVCTYGPDNTVIDCGKLALCMSFGSGACVCNASSCTAKQDSDTFTCDLRFDAAQAHGSCTEGAQVGSTTQLERAE